MSQQNINSFFKISTSDDNSIQQQQPPPQQPTQSKKLSIFMRDSDLPPEDVYNLYFDGCCKGNPGEAGAGAVIYKNGREIWFGSMYVGEFKTNNIAEYTGLLMGLNQAISYGIKKINIKGDSQLVIKQMTGEYKVNSEKLKEYNTLARKLVKQFSRVSYEHVYREYNRRADNLSNQGLEKNPKYILHCNSSI